MADFVLPKITDNPNGWGPCAVPEKFKDMPYQPFSKSDRLGKVSDWAVTGNPMYNDKKYNNKYASQFATTGAGQYAYYHEHDDQFQVVDTLKPSKPMFRGMARGRFMPMQRGRGRGVPAPTRPNNQSGNAWRGNNNNQANRGWQRGKFQRGGRNRNWQSNNRNQVSRKASVEVKLEWDEIDYYDFPRLTKLKLPDVNKPVELIQAGTLEYYDKKFDKVNTKSERKLTDINRRIPTVTTTLDPIIRKIAAKHGNVYATDVILATLMCCTRSVYSWDIVATKVKGKIFLDKREDSLSFDCLTVNETAHEPPSLDPNELKSLSEESTHVNYCFTQQVLRTDIEPHGFKEPNPFEDDDDDDEEENRYPLAPIGYKYRMWDLGNNISLVCRCEQDAISVGPDDKKQFLTIKALNEVEHRSDWHQKLDQQSGAIIATEMKNNSFKIGKWCLQAYLAGSDMIKLGFVSRVNPRDNKIHEILKVQTFQPSELASSINLNFDNCWGVLRAIIDAINRQPEEEGKYLLLKDPNKTTIRLYKIPMNTFSDEEDSDEDDTIPEENENN
ncbi:eukaryotic translation initiation factor 3 subunit D-like [Convolutriloba macropyga]|uniref:eukaryotic translation initiation factor 3 subunit D-like n=1 Tax=Convolutriloba macropyga TaxID=536237 RepID=UPI003F523C62